MLNYAIIGTNWITDSWIESAQATKHWNLVAVYSRNEETAKKFGQKYKVTKTYTSLEGLASDSEIQAVYIASPNSLHYSQAAQLLEAKKHVVLEKPSTSTVAELDSLYALAAKRGVFLLEAFRHIQEANFKRLRDAVTVQKRLGSIFGASLSYASYSSRYDSVLAGEEPNIFSLDFSGGSLVDIGVYPISFAVALFGPPSSQSYAPYICRTGADGGGFVTLRYAGFGVQIAQSKCFASAAASEIYGEKGTVTLNATTDIASVRFRSNQTKETEELAGPVAEKNMMEEAEELGRIIEDGDGEAAGKLEAISRAVLEITTDLRRQNGIVFKVERT